MLDIIKDFNELQRKEEAARTEYQAVICDKKERIEKAEARIDKARNHVAKMEEKYRALPHTGWVKGIVEPLAELLAARTGLYWKIYGPFGLSCETSIYLMEDKDACITKQTTRSITLEPYFQGVGDDMAIRYRTDEIIERYPEGSLGQVNGMNCVTATLPETIEEIEKLLKENEVAK